MADTNTNAGETKRFPHGTTIDELGRDRSPVRTDGTNPIPPEREKLVPLRPLTYPPSFGQAKAIERILLRLESIDGRLSEVQDAVARLAGEQG